MENRDSGIARGLFLATAAVAMIGATGVAVAGQTPETFLTAVNRDKDKTLTLPEVTAYALKRFAALDINHDGTLSADEIGDRLSADDFALADTRHKAGERTLTKAEFTSYVAKLFATANENVKPGATKVDSTLTVEELGTPAGLKLIKLLD